MISSEMQEILGLSDRILVLSQGRVTGEFDIKDASQEAILKCAVETKEAILHDIASYEKNTKENNR